MITLGFINTVEAWALKSPLAYLLSVAFILISAFALYYYQFQIFYPKTVIKYEEEEEPVLIGLDYKSPSYKNTEK